MYEFPRQEFLDFVLAIDQLITHQSWITPKEWFDFNNYLLSVLYSDDSPQCNSIKFLLDLAEKDPGQLDIDSSQPESIPQEILATIYDKANEIASTIASFQLSAVKISAAMLFKQLNGWMNTSVSMDDLSNVTEQDVEPGDVRVDINDFT